jgi:phosphohistidine phosphatase SixA
VKLWIGRHSWAGPASSDPDKEMHRELLPEGVATAKAIANAMVQADEIPNAIFASPYTRATQTALIYAKIFGVNVAVIGDLAPLRPLTTALVSLVGATGREKLKRAMIVGHTDNITPTMRDLDDGDWAPEKMSEVRRVEISRKDMSWKLKWAIRPRDLGLPEHGA